MRSERRRMGGVVVALVAAFGLLALAEPLRAGPATHFGTFSSQHGQVKLMEVSDLQLGGRLIWGYLQKPNGNTVRLFGTVNESGQLVLLICGEHDNGVAELSLSSNGTDYAGSIRFHSGWKIHWTLEKM